MQDLWISVRHGRVVLRSRRLNREVIPRLSSAHNFGRGLHLYRFLCALQNQNVVRLSPWSWGALERFAHLPRVRAGPVVLARARWTLTQVELQTLDARTAADRFLAAQRLREGRSLPRWVVQVDGDHALPVDFDSVLSVEAFARAAKGLIHLQLEELFPAPDGLGAEGPEGKFVHQVVVPFIEEARSRGGAAAESPVGAPASSGRSTRYFPPGSEWLYLKIYTGRSSADRILAEVIDPWISAVHESGWVNRWFFIRYRDPGWHLRIRLRGESGALLGKALPRLNESLAPWLEDRTVQRLQLDSYEREIERYGGGPAIDCAEALFQADSEFALAAIQQLPGDAGLEERWRLCLSAMDALMSDFRLDLLEKLALAQRARDAFRRELKVDLRLTQQLGRNYRGLSGRLSQEVITPPSGSGAASEVPVWRPLISWRSAQIAPLVTTYRELLERNTLTVGRESLLQSFLHMQVNRLMRASPRQHEAVMYDFLTRLYESALARSS